MNQELFLHITVFYGLCTSFLAVACLALSQPLEFSRGAKRTLVKRNYQRFLQGNAIYGGFVCLIALLLQLLPDTLLSEDFSLKSCAIAVCAAFWLLYFGIFIQLVVFGEFQNWRAMREAIK